MMEFMYAFWLCEHENTQMMDHVQAILLRQFQSNRCFGLLLDPHVTDTLVNHLLHDRFSLSFVGKNQQMIDILGKLGD